MKIVVKTKNKTVKKLKVGDFTIDGPSRSSMLVFEADGERYQVGLNDGHVVSASLDEDGRMYFYITEHKAKLKVKISDEDFLKLSNDFNYEVGQIIIFMGQAYINVYNDETEKFAQVCLSSGFSNGWYDSLEKLEDNIKNSLERLYNKDIKEKGWG